MTYIMKAKFHPYPPLTIKKDPPANAGGSNMTLIERITRYEITRYKNYS